MSLSNPKFLLGHFRNSYSAINRRLRPPFDLEQEEGRVRREIEAGDRPAPPRDHRFLEDLEELL